MKPYGGPRDKDFETPDKGDLKLFGRKSSAGRLPGKGGDIRNSVSSKNKKAARRVLKKSARIKSTHEMKKDID